VSYQTEEVPLLSAKTMLAAPKLQLYDSIDQGVMESYQEFTVAALLYYTMKESACSEQSSRMTAMDNASKNAGNLNSIIIVSLDINFSILNILYHLCIF